MKMRAALESEHTGLHLHSWIDCIWGVSQRNVKIRNTFTDICYADSTIIKNHCKSQTKRLLRKTDDLESYFKKDCHLSSGERMKFQALDLQVSQFGRVPKCIFSFAHPKKKIKSMQNKKQNDMSFDKELNLLGISPLDFEQPQSFSDIHGNTEIQTTSRFEDFDVKPKSKN